ncbi:histidine phosphatase family protein [Diaphorobacter ruginosibacter]|uniref:histidine phosphatase family protein n=1 Tax=Diaphorobacter ruginosibacter TaxID=1715720 RepID=UPI00333FDFD1
MRERPPPRLWLVRHARPLIGPGICYGAQDVPADDGHSRQSALALSGALPDSLALVAHSPLSRCGQLARAWSAHRAAPRAQADARLREMDFGNWEGQRWDAIPRTELDAWTDRFASYRPGGGEPLQAMLGRVSNALRDAHAASLENAGRDVVWITHAGVIRCVLWLGEHDDSIPRACDWTMPAPEFGKWFSVPLTTPQ